MCKSLTVLNTTGDLGKCWSNPVLGYTREGPRLAGCRLTECSSAWMTQEHSSSPTEPLPCSPGGHHHSPLHDCPPSSGSSQGRDSGPGLHMGAGVTERAVETEPSVPTEPSPGHLSQQSLPPTPTAMPLSPRSDPHLRSNGKHSSDHPAQAQQAHLLEPKHHCTLFLPTSHTLLSISSAAN